MTIFEKNYEALKLKPYLLEKMNELDKNSLQNNKLSNIYETETKESAKSLTISINSNTYRLNSNYYPSKEAKAWASQFEFTDLHVYVSMYGMGNGIFTRALIERLRPDDMMFVYEPCADLFFYVLNHFDISDILSNSSVTIAVEEVNDYEFHTILRDSIDWLNVHYQVLCNHPYYDEIFQNSYKTFLLELKDNNNKALINRNTTALFGEMSISNTLQNLKYLKESNVEMDFYDDFSTLDVPAIIVAAGPSLNKNIEFLKEAKGKAIIFVVDRALDYVLNHGIEPDFIVTLDSSKPIEYFSDRRDITTPLLCTIDASKPVMEAHKGRKIFFAIKGYVSYLFYEMNKKTSTLNSGGCVATGTFSVCVGIGFKTIILMGQDLAFSKDKTTHADGIKGDGEIYKRVHKLVEGIDGDLVETRHDWYSYLTWYQDSIRELPDITVVDATEGGAKIKGTIIMPLKDAISTYCKKEVDCKSIVESKNPTFSKDDIKKVYNLLKTCVDNLKEIKKGGNKAKQYCSKLVIESKKLSIGSKYSQELVAKISEINETVMKYPAYKFVDSDISIAAITNLSNIYRLTGDEKQDQITTYLKAEKIYTAIMESADKIRPQVESILPLFEVDDKIE